MNGVRIPKIHEMLSLSFEQPQGLLYMTGPIVMVEIVIGALDAMGGPVTGSNISFIE